jgi:ABC-type phosphate transport system substrate-binding protein
MTSTMTRRNALRALGALTLMGALSTTGKATAARRLAVVVNRASPLSSLSAEAVRAYFLKQHKEWASGEKVRPVQQEGAAHAAFLAKVLKMSSSDYERYWLERKYSAAETPPKGVDDDAAVAKFVGAMKGAIGYVDWAALEESARNKLKVIHAINF